MDSIPFKKSKVLVKTIPKGTLLFRIVGNPIDDLRGVEIGEGKRCLTPNYNVFFHPNPFMGSIALKDYLRKEDSKIYFYVLTKDIKVIYLLSPSKYTRRTKNSKGMFIKRCSTVKQGCLPNVGKWYDPCVSDAMIAQHPDVVGIMALSIGDTDVLKKNLNKTRRVSKFFKYAKDARGVKGIPELILHPLTKRPQSDVITTESDNLENNYKTIKSFDREDIPAMETFMEKHAVYNPETYFYTYKE